MLILILSSIAVEKREGVQQLGTVALEFVSAEGGSLPVTVLIDLGQQRIFGDQ